MKIYNAWLTIAIFVLISKLFDTDSIEINNDTTDKIELKYERNNKTLLLRLPGKTILCKCIEINIILRVDNDLSFKHKIFNFLCR